MGCTVVSYAAVHRELMASQLRVASLVEPVFPTDISIVTKANRPITAAMRAMMDMLRHEFARLIDSPETPCDFLIHAKPVQLEQRFWRHPWLMGAANF
jgi:hypothetical protein